MTLDEKISELNSAAHNLAFDWYLRKGIQHPFLTHIMSATKSLEAFAKFNPYHDELGRFTFGPGGGAEGDSNSNSNEDDGNKDPGAVPVKLPDGSVVKNPKTGEPIMMPKGVSLQDNAETGQAMGLLPEPAGGIALVAQMRPGGSMDYQRLYNGGQYNPAYTDFGNYNFGVVAAAMGYSLNEAMTAVGIFNQYWERNTDTSGTHGTDASENTFVPMGYNDYTSGRITPSN